MIAVTSEGVSVGKWDGLEFQTFKSSTLRASCGSSGNQVQINRAEIAVETQFNFFLTTNQGAGDEAPDTDFWTYGLAGGPSSPPAPPPPGQPPPGPPPPPTAGGLAGSFGADSPPHYAHWRVRFDAVTFGAASYAWQFGDGTSAQTKVPLAFHRYAAAGTYVVTLVVTDGAGVQAQSTLQVEVTALPAGARLPTIAGPSPDSRKDPGYSRVASKESKGSRSVLCWNTADWAILERAFDEKGTGGYVDPATPRQIGLAPSICSRLDLITYRKPAPPASSKTAAAVLILASEIERTAGYLSPAQITCYGLQRVPDTSRSLGAAPTAAERLGRLAATWYSHRNLPPGYWSPQCRDGGKLDLDPTNAHWP